MKCQEIYLDNASTTQIAPQVVEKINSLYTNKIYGNASSIHKAGIKAAIEIEKARSLIASKLNASPEEIYFVSCGTEANNWVMKGLFEKVRSMHIKPHFIVSSTEHPSILAPSKWLKMQGCDISLVPVDEKGVVKLDSLQSEIRKETVLISVQHANNETGTLQPIEKIAQLAKNFSIPFHVDACQTFLKEPIDLINCPITFLTINAHKVHGPKGIAALYIKDEASLPSLLLGGEQEQGFRAGTYNLEGIVGFGATTQVIQTEGILKMRALKKYFWDKVQSEISNITLNGDINNSVCHILNISIFEIDGSHLLQELNREGIYVSTGSACKASVKTPSHVLLAMGKSIASANSSIRISFNQWQKEEELDLFLLKLKNIVAKLRQSNDSSK